MFAIYDVFLSSIYLIWFSRVIYFAGEDLLAIAADQPFRFPATFTFVVRAFSGLLFNSLRAN